MLKVVRILFQGTVKRFALDHSELRYESNRHESVKDVVFPQGGVSCGNDESLASLIGYYCVDTFLT